MKTNYFFVHGTFGNAEYHWFGWLKEELIRNGFEVIAPEFETLIGVNNYGSRQKILKIYYENGLINENTVFIGHSSGPIIVSKFLIEEKIKVKGLISVSGFNNATTPYADYNKINSDFFVTDEILREINDYVKFVVCYYSDNDPYLSVRDLEIFALLTCAEKQFIKDAGHFNTDSGYTKFLDILRVIKQIEDGLSLMENNDLPVGINFIIKNDSGQILLARRINRFGEGTYGLIGEKLKNMENFEDAAVRRLKEEVGIDVNKNDLEFVNIATTITNMTFLQIGVLVKKYSGTPIIMEPNKCDDLRFFDLDDLPELFVGTKPNIELFINNEVYDVKYNVNSNE